VRRWLEGKRKKYGVEGPRWKEKVVRWVLHKSIFGLPAYAVHLAAWQAYTVKSKRVQSFILGSLDVPHWNYVIKLLCNDPTLYLSAGFITGYVAKTGYEWGQWERKGEKLPTGEKYKLTKEVLDWLWDNYEHRHN